MNGQVLFNRFRLGAIVPKRNSEWAAGFDLYHLATPGVLRLSGLNLLNTGIRLIIPNGYVGLLRPRGGTFSRFGIRIIEGTIDADFRGELKIQAEFPNMSEIPTEPLAQLVVVPHLLNALEITEETFDQMKTIRGVNMLGSTTNIGDE